MDTDLCDSANVIEKLNIEFDTVQSENELLKSKLKEYDQVQEAIKMLEEMINDESFEAKGRDCLGCRAGLPCGNPNRGENCWSNYHIAKGKIYHTNPPGFPAADWVSEYDSLNLLWDENGSTTCSGNLYEKKDWIYIDILDIACPHKGSIMSGAFVVPDNFSTCQERINRIKEVQDSLLLYEFKSTDIIKYYNKEIKDLPFKILNK